MASKAPQLLRVLYDFAAEEEGELSVRAGELVALVGQFRRQAQLANFSAKCVWC